jgi:hypothetical protein
VDEKGRAILLPPPPLPKDDAMYLIKEAMKHLHIVRYVFIDEAWTVRGKERDELPDDLSQHPERKEIILFNAEDKNGEQLLASRDIIREGGQPRLGPLVFSDMNMMSGRMIGLLVEAPPKNRVN